MCGAGVNWPTHMGHNNAGPLCTRHDGRNIHMRACANIEIDTCVCVCVCLSIDGMQRTAAIYDV
jgi:hypothetical protein